MHHTGTLILPHRPTKGVRQVGSGGRLSSCWWLTQLRAQSPQERNPRQPSIIRGQYVKLQRPISVQEFTAIRLLVDIAVVPRLMGEFWGRLA